MYEFALNAFLNASIEDVYDAFTKPEFITQWCEPNNLNATQFIGTVMPGETFKLILESEDGFQQAVVGTYHEVDALQTLSFSWRWEDTNEITKVGVSLTDLANGSTKIMLSQKGFKQKAEMLQQQFAWIDCLEKLSLKLLQFSGVQTSDFRNASYLPSNLALV